MADLLELERHFKDFLDMHDPFLYARWLSGIWTISEFLEMEPQLRPHWKRFRQIHNIS